PASAKCDVPFARMAGTNTWQRSVLTANNGLYYVDTTRSQLYQRKTTALGDPKDEAANYVECDFKPTGNCSQRSVNVFLKNATYYVFVLFPKGPPHPTRQTYQIYVGKDFNLDTVKTALMVSREINFKVDIKDKLPGGWEKKKIGQHEGDAK